MNDSIIQGEEEKKNENQTELSQSSIGALAAKLTQKYSETFHKFATFEEI